MPCPPESSDERLEVSDGGREHWKSRSLPPAGQRLPHYRRRNSRLLGSLSHPLSPRLPRIGGKGAVGSRPRGRLFDPRRREGMEFGPRRGSSVNRGCSSMNGLSPATP